MRGTNATAINQPVIVDRVYDQRSTPGVTQGDIILLRQRLERGDRAGVYCDLYKLTGHDIWLMHAQITSYSGLYGGAALSANFLAKLANPTKYNVALDVFSRQIVQEMLRVVERDVNNGGSGRPSVDNLRNNGDRKVWADKDMGNHFPGNLLFGEFWEHGLGGIGTLLSKGSLHGIDAGWNGAENGKRPSEFKRGPYRTVKSRENRFTTVIDTRTNYVEVFFDTKASEAIGIIGQIDDEPLTRLQYQWHERTALWEFLQANQDNEQTMNHRLLPQGGRESTPNPNVPGLFDNTEFLERRMFRNPQDGNWYNTDAGGRVRDGRLIGLLEERRAEALAFRKQRGLPAEPQLPPRYVSAGLWPERTADTVTAGAAR